MWLKRKGEGEKEMSFRNWVGFAMVTRKCEKEVALRSIFVSKKSGTKKLLAQVSTSSNNLKG